MFKLKYVVFVSTFCIFFIEAIIHYNIGNNKLSQLSFPSKDDLLKIIITLFIFSIINAYVSKFFYKL